MISTLFLSWICVIAVIVILIQIHDTDVDGKYYRVFWKRKKKLLI